MGTGTGSSGNNNARLAIRGFNDNRGRTRSSHGAKVSRAS